MNIVVVSAHYPPNFVSGGTLQPQRLARGLRNRGHQVHVYAGWLDLEGADVEGRRPLDTWTEVDDGDVPVRWIVTTPFIGWGDRENYDNPAVESDFGAWLEQIAPDVVHVHALQSLGVGVIRAAAAQGVPVVLTMHDFWWSCARQFLVDRTMKPCSLVVDAGVCECEVDREWLDARDAVLRDVLASVAVVLAPSAPAATVLAANGIDEQRLRTDENGFPPESVTIEPPKDRHRSRQDSLRFTYAGGENEMKGVHVLFAAAVQLASVPGWRLRAYGAQPYLSRTGTSVANAPVDVAPPFEPSELDRVLEDTDVLVIPSVMRESHSLLTREALLAGVPIVTSDSIGPEEVVRDGINGLVVPSDDVDGLAAALRRLVDDRELVDRLRAGCLEVPVAVRSLDDQLAGLEQIFFEVARRDAVPLPAATTPRRITNVVFMAGIEGAPLRYRARLPAEALELLGVECEVRHYRDVELPRLIDHADALYVYRVPATPQVLDLLARAATHGIPRLFDVDDLIFDPDLAAEIPALRLLPTDEADLWLEGVRRYRTTMEHCDVYVGSTQMLVDHAATVTGLPTARFDNGVGLQLGRLSDAEVRRSRQPGPLRIGYLSGTTTHDDDWAFVEPAVIRVLDERPDVELWLVGHLPATTELTRFGDRVRRLPFMAWTELPSVLRDLDVNLAPLEPNSRFNEAKSAIKWLEAALCGTVTVASPTGPFCDAIVDGENGLLAATHDEWHAAVAVALDDGARRRRMAARARRDALLRWSPHRQGPRFVELLETAQATVVADGQTRTSTWALEVRDEPLMEIELEPYGSEAPLPNPVPRRPSVRNRAGRIVRAAGRRLRR